MGVQQEDTLTIKVHNRRISVILMCPVRRLYGILIIEHHQAALLIPIQMEGLVEEGDITMAVRLWVVLLEVLLEQRPINQMVREVMEALEAVSDLMVWRGVRQAILVITVLEELGACQDITIM
jgi:hypothetical protein